MTTITLTQIVRAHVTTVRALTPSEHSDRKFDRCPTDVLLRQWVTANAGSPCFRKFEIRRVGIRRDPGTQDPSAALVERDLELVVSYPAKLPGLYTDESDEQLDALEAIAEADARQIRDALFSPLNLAGAGHQATWPVIAAFERTGDVWFQRFDLRVAYNQAQSLVFV